MKPAAVFAVLMLWPSLAFPAETYCTAHRLPEEVADPAFSKPMRYVVGVIDGKTVLQASGRVGQNESQRLSEAMHRAGRIDEVWLHSPGGSAIEGTRMGRVLRRAGVLTRLREGQACISACSIAFLGGLLRVVEPRSYFGIHMMTTTRNTELMVSMMDQMAQLSRLRKAAIRQRLSTEQVDALVSEAAGRGVRMVEQIAATIAADQARYLVEMSVSLEFMTEEFNQPAHGVCYLGEPGLRKFNVSNMGAQVPGIPVPSLPPPGPVPSSSPGAVTAAVP